MMSMLKGAARQLIRAAGFDVVPYQPPRRTRRTNELVCHATATGKYYLPRDSDADLIAEAIRRDAIFDRPVYEVARQHIVPGTTALDVGSNFGQMAVLMSKLVGDAGEVHAFDADDFIYSILEKNAAMNAANIRTHFGAVHDKANETLYFPEQDFDRFGSYGSYGIDYVHGKGRPVPTIVIDDIPFRLPVTFMKVDVQGGDLLALRGAVRTIQRYQMPIVFEYEYAFEQELKLNFQEYVDFVREIDYRFASSIDGQNYLILPRTSRERQSQAHI